MNIIIGKNKAVVLGVELEQSVYQISARRFCVTAEAAWKAELDSAGIWYDRRYRVVKITRGTE